VQTLYWNPGAVSFLVELLLALVLSVYVAHRLVREHRGGGITAPTLLFGLTFWCFVPGLFVSLLHALTGGGWTSYAMPWLAPDSLVVLAMPWVTAFTGISAIAFVQFAYRVPQWLPGAQREAMLVGMAMSVCVWIEIASSLHTDWTLAEHRIWFRPDWAAIWTSASMIWAILVFMRQLAHAQGRSRDKGLGTWLAMLLRRPANRSAGAARGFILFALFPIAHTCALLFQRDGYLGPFSMDLLICWSTLVQLTGLTLVYFGYLPERSSFIFKLTIISLVLLFGAINGACWVLATPYIAQFRPADLPHPGTALEFVPMAKGGYQVRERPAAPLPTSGRPIGPDGARIVLPFTVRFYGKPYRAAYVAGHGSIGLDALPHLIDSTIAYGVRPAIRPLLMRIPPEGSDVTARAVADRLVVTRKDRCSAMADTACWAVQTVVHADGRIVLAYLSGPAAPPYQLADPLGAPWMTGITPGLEHPGAAPMMRDHYRAFLAHLDRLYAPVLGFTLGTMLIVLLGMPLLFQGFLVRPLDRLLRAMRRFRDGELDRQVEVSFNDEIGYLTESFNEMARAQNHLVNTLEEQVASRSAELADFAARNARLEERNRLSGDLHDTVSQTLFSAAMLSDALADQWQHDPQASTGKLRQLAQMNRHALAEMRLMLNELRAEGMVEQPLAHLIAALAREFAEGQGDRVQIACDISGDTLLPLDVQAMLYRIAQESLNNIARHAGASQVSIALEALPGQAMLSIRDNGSGFDPHKVPGGHLGLQIMRERARRIDAVLEVESRPGGGTGITAIWMQQA